MLNRMTYEVNHHPRHRNARLRHTFASRPGSIGLCHLPGTFYMRSTRVANIRNYLFHPRIHVYPQRKTRSSILRIMSKTYTINSYA